MSNTEAFIDRLESRIDNLKAENEKLRAELASATEKANHLPGLTANLDELHWAMNLVRDRLDQNANVELSTEQRTAFRVIIEDTPRRSWPPTGQDIEQARLEREVARAAVAETLANAEYQRVVDAFVAGPSIAFAPIEMANDQARAARDKASMARAVLTDHILAKREGGAK